MGYSQLSVDADVVFFPGTGNHYELITSNVTWEEADLMSSKHVFLGVPGHLATLTNQEENDFLAEAFDGASGWIGLRQKPGSIEPDQGFQWVTNEELDFTNWNGNEPNNSGGDEEFVEIFNGRWNDLSATSTRRYYLEYETKGNQLGDINCDGSLDLLDVDPFVTLLANGMFEPKADMNCDGFVDLLDVQPFVDLLAGD